MVLAVECESVPCQRSTKGWFHSLEPSATAIAAIRAGVHHVQAIRLANINIVVVRLLDESSTNRTTTQQTEEVLVLRRAVGNLVQNQGPGTKNVRNFRLIR